MTVKFAADDDWHNALLRIFTFTAENKAMAKA